MSMGQIAAKTVGTIGATLLALSVSLAVSAMTWAIVDTSDEKRWDYALGHVAIGALIIGLVMFVLSLLALPHDVT